MQRLLPGSFSLQLLNDMGDALVWKNQIFDSHFKFSKIPDVLYFVGTDFMEMSLLRVKNTVGWVRKDMIMQEQGYF